MGKGTYLRNSGAWVFDLENDSYYIPVGIGKSVNDWTPRTCILVSGDSLPTFCIKGHINLRPLLRLSKPADT